MREEALICTRSKYSVDFRFWQIDGFPYERDHHDIST